MAGRRDTGLAALAGLAAGAVTLGVGSLVALLTGPSTDPLVAVGSAFVDATPAWLKDFAASTFGTADKVVLGIGEVRGPARARRAGRGARRAALGVGRDARRRAGGRRGAGGDGPTGRGDARRGAGGGRRDRGSADPAGAGPSPARSTRATASRGCPAARVPAGHGRGGSARRGRGGARSGHRRRCPRSAVGAGGDPDPARRHDGGARARGRRHRRRRRRALADARGRVLPDRHRPGGPAGGPERPGPCACTAWSRRRSRSPGTSCWRATSSRRG